MSTRRKEMPPPDTSGTEIDSALSKRFSLGVNTSSIPDPYTGKGEYGSGMGKSKKPKPARATQDPEGMRRVSYYVSAQAADALDAAADRIQSVLGSDVLRHVALSALITAGTMDLEQVIKQLATDRAAALADRIAQLEKADS